jgi:integrase
MTKPTKRRRRARGEGAISKRKNGGWTGVLDLGWQDGKRKRKFVYARTRAEVARKLANERRKLEEAGSSPTSARPSSRPTGLAGDDRADHRPEHPQALRAALPAPRLPARRQIAAHQARTTHLAPLYTQRIKTGLSPTTVLQLHRVLHHALKDAHRQGLAPRNVADLVTAPIKAEHEFSTFSPKQARRFLETVKGDRLEALYAAALTTGMREGELLGLRWADVDLDQGALYVTRRLKRRTSRRQVLLIAPAVEALKLHQERQDDERRRAGSTWHHEGLVFPKTVGRVINPPNFLRRDFYPLLERAGPPRMRFYDLRHSAATLLLKMGVHPKIVSELLGHTQIGIAMDLYSHVTATMQRDAVTAFEELLGSTKGSKPGSKQDEEPERTS